MRQRPQLPLVEVSPKCGCDLEIRAAIHDPEEIKRYLRQIGLAEHIEITTRF